MLGSNISLYRRQKGMTQEQLAQKLDVTNQAVSKWETDQCCPDVVLLPQLADIFGVSIDALFGRETAKQKPKDLPWKDDNALHIAVFVGHTLVGAASRENQDCTFHYEGPVRDVYCQCGLSCGQVQGNVDADGFVECTQVGGNVNAGGYVECGDVGGNVNAGSYVECSDVSGSLYCGAYVECGNVGGNITSGGYVECGNVGGKVTSPGTML